MRRVVVTGMGIVSSIGVDKDEVLTSLRTGQTGIEFSQAYRDLGLRSQVHGPLRIAPEAHIDRKLHRFMGNAAAYSYLAMSQAIEDAGLPNEAVSHPRTGMIAGSGGGSPANQVLAADLLRGRGIRKVGPYMVPRTMSSTTSACLSVGYKIRGINYSIGSACATSAHCIGSAMEQIQWDKQDIMFAGGGEEVDWAMTLLFDGMSALSSKYNDNAGAASRPYDADRDGFVISGGGGMLILEELGHARQRGARIYAEVVGYGASSDGDDMVQPSGEGAARCMQNALDGLSGPIDYINAHGTSTPIGDLKELEAIDKVFGARIPPISSTKSLTGHALGAAGVNEAIYTLLMMEHEFIAATANVETLDQAASGFPLVLERRDNVALDTVMSNSFGFGGTNASLVFKRVTD